MINDRLFLHDFLLFKWSFYCSRSLKHLVCFNGAFHTVLWLNMYYAWVHLSASDWDEIWGKNCLLWEMFAWCCSALRHQHSWEFVQWRWRWLWLSVVTYRRLGHCRCKSILRDYVTNCCWEMRCKGSNTSVNGASIRCGLWHPTMRKCCTSLIPQDQCTTNFFFSSMNH